MFVAFACGGAAVADAQITTYGPNPALTLGANGNYANNYTFAGFSPQDHPNGGAGSPKYDAYNYLILNDVNPNDLNWAPSAAAGLNVSYPGLFWPGDGQTLWYGDEYIHSGAVGEFVWGSRHPAATPQSATQQPPAGQLPPGAVSPPNANANGVVGNYPPAGDPSGFYYNPMGDVVSVAAKSTAPTPPPGGTTTPAPPPGGGTTSTTVNFDHPWTGNVESALRSLLATGLAGADGSNGQLVVDQMNGMGGIYAGGEFQPHHDGVGAPTYGYGWFYVSYVDIGGGTIGYQIVEFGTPPAGD